MECREQKYGVGDFERSEILKQAQVLQEISSKPEAEESSPQ